MMLPMATEQPPTAARRRDSRVATVIAFYEGLTPGTLPRLGAVYADEVRFIDPFNDVQGLARIRAVFEHMFATLDAPRFEILESVMERDQCFLVWDFSFRRQGRDDTTVVHGTSHLRFAADGRVQWHRDYWDPARELYEGLPVLGAVLRWLRRRLAGPA